MSKKVVICGVAVLAVFAGLMWFLRSPETITSIDAVVEGRIVAVGLDVSGVVKTVHVRAGDAVAKNQPLLKLDAAAFERQLAQERTRLAEIAAQLPPKLLVPSPGSAQPALGKTLTALRGEEEAAKARVEAAAQAAAQADIAFARLNARSSATQSERESARIAKEEAAAGLKKARDEFEKVSYARAQRERQDSVDKSNEVVSAALAALLAQYQAQIYQVRLAERNLAATTLIAPENGTVFLLAAQPGRTVAIGDSPVAILPEKDGELWIFAEFSAEDKAILLDGTPCEVTLEGSAARMRATLDGLLPGQETEKRVAVRVTLDQQALPPDLSPGKAVSVLVSGGSGSFFDTFPGKGKNAARQN